MEDKEHLMNPQERQPLIDQIRRFPAELSALVEPLSAAQLDTVSIPGEWTVRQIVHHLADSHTMSVIRLKLVLTLDRPPLLGYPQEVWAELTDVSATPIEASLNILRGLHARWAALFESLSETQWQRVGIHSENGEVSPEDMLQVYAAHGQEHIAQIQKVLGAQANL